MSDCNCPLTEAAKDAPGGLAILTKDLSLTFSELHRHAGFYTEQLQRMGVRSGDRVALRHSSDWRIVALLFAVWRLGASLCPLHLRLPLSEIETCLKRLAPSLYVTEFFFKTPLVLQTPSTLPASLLLFTSGSTGTPKIAVLSRENLLANAKSAFSALDLRPNDRWLLSLPLFHVGGIGIVLRCILARAAILWDIPEATHLSYVPTQLYRAWPVSKRLRCLLLGGAPLPRFSDQLPIYPTYGLTEMGSVVCARPQGIWKDERLYLGSPLEGRQLRIASDGEILVRGSCLFQGYWEEHQLRSPLDADGWFKTGDIGHFCEKEGLAVLGRKDWQFISGGENIQPEEIENKLLALPQIEEAAVIPLPDPEFGYRPAAAVQVNDRKFDLEEMRKQLSASLPKYKIPIALFHFDSLPRTSLKIDRKKIFELVGQKLSK